MAKGDQDEPEARRLNDAMVNGLVSEAVIRDGRVEQAFRSVLRHWFLPNVPVADVYSGRAIPTRWGPNGPISSSSEPAIMAKMLEQLDLRPGQAVLEVGAGTGYNAALLAAIVGPEGSVATIDLDADITAAATAHLAGAGVANAKVITGDGWAGAPGRGPFDRIEATVGVWDLSPSWLDQLRAGGVLVAPLWLRCGLQASVAFHKDNSLRSRSVQPCGFMRLRGAGAGPEACRQMGAWTATFDDADDRRHELLAQLLEEEPVVCPVGDLAPGWFTAIALAEPDAVNLFSLPDGKPTSRAGLLDPASRTLALVETEGLVGCSAPRRLLTFGGDQALRRLMDLLERMPALELPGLRIDAVADSAERADDGAVATLGRRHFAFVIRSEPA